MWHWTIRVCQITDMTDSISFTFRISSQIEYARLIQLFICDIPAFCILSSMYPFLEQTQWYASLWCQILSSCQCSAVVLVETDPTFLSFLPMTNKFFLQSPIPRQHLSSSPFSTTAETRCISVVGFSCTLSNSIVTRWTFWACFVDECLSPIRLKPTYQMECMILLACLASLCMKVFILFSGHCMFLWDGPRTLIWCILVPWSCCLLRFSSQI